MKPLLLILATLLSGFTAHAGVDANLKAQLKRLEGQSVSYIGYENIQEPYRNWIGHGRVEKISQGLPYIGTPSVTIRDRDGGTHTLEGTDIFKTARSQGCDNLGHCVGQQGVYVVSWGLHPTWFHRATLVGQSFENPNIFLVKVESPWHNGWFLWAQPLSMNLPCKGAMCPGNTVITLNIYGEASKAKVVANIKNLFLCKDCSPLTVTLVLTEAGEVMPFYPEEISSLVVISKPGDCSSSKTFCVGDSTYRTFYQDRDLEITEQVQVIAVSGNRVLVSNKDGKLNWNTEPSSFQTRGCIPYSTVNFCVGDEVNVDSNPDYNFKILAFKPDSKTVVIDWQKLPRSFPLQRISPAAVKINAAKNPSGM